MLCRCAAPACSRLEEVACPELATTGEERQNELVLRRKVPVHVAFATDARSISSPIPTDRTERRENRSYAVSRIRSRAPSSCLCSVWRTLNQEINDQNGLSRDMRQAARFVTTLPVSALGNPAAASGWGENTGRLKNDDDRTGPLRGRTPNRSRPRWVEADALLRLFAHVGALAPRRRLPRASAAAAPEAPCLRPAAVSYTHLTLPTTERV